MLRELPKKHHVWCDGVALEITGELIKIQIKLVD